MQKCALEWNSTPINPNNCTDRPIDAVKTWFNETENGSVMGDAL